MSLISNGRVLNAELPVIMGVINLTPDSFYKASRRLSVQEAVDQAATMLEQGASILDLGAISTRPGADEIDAETELKRLLIPLTAIRKAFPEAFLSVDTYRSKVAYEAVNAGADMINDISGGTFDDNMFSTVSRLSVPYVLMHTGGRPATMQDNPVYEDVLQDVRSFFLNNIETLRGLGVKQIILDPGFGFGKTIEHNYRLLAGMHMFNDLGCVVMAGISRKSMINRILSTTADEALNGTTILNTIALLNGVDILRVHDVKEAMQCRKLVNVYKNYGYTHQI